MNYIETLKSPRRRAAVVVAVVVLHIIMIYGWFNLKLYGGAHRGPSLIRVEIVRDAKPAPHVRPQIATPHAPARR